MITPASSLAAVRAYRFPLAPAVCAGALLLLGQPSPALAHLRTGVHHAAPGYPAGHPVPQSYLGIDVRSIGEDEIQFYHLHDARGALILRVDHDGPAGKMGLRERDVILQMNNIQIDGEEQLRRMLRDLPPGRPVQMVVSRDGQLLILQTQMGDRAEVDRQAWAQHLTPAPAATGPDPAAPPPPAPSRYSRSFLGSLLTSPTYTGAVVETITPQLAQFFGAGSNAGLLVRSVAANSPSAMAGMHAGDVILRANGHGIFSLGDWSRVIKEAKGQPVTVVVLRDHVEHTLTVIPDSKHHASLEHPPAPVARNAPPAL